MSITRRIFLRHTAAAGVVGAVAAPAVAEPIPSLTSDERIEAAIEEIKAAFWEKWPNAPLRISEFDNIDNGMVLVLSHVGNDKPGEVHHRRNGLARKGGACAVPPGERPRPLVPALREMFGLSTTEAVEAIRQSHQMWPGT